VKRLALALMSGVLALGAVEGILRLAVQAGWPRVLADPGRYADPLSDDLFWVLRARGGLTPALRRHTAHEQDPRLGWVPDRRNLNALEGWQSPRYPDGASRTVAVFGDSFVFGTVPDGERLADHLQASLPGTRALNYGVAGYGLDQIVLRLAERSEVLQRLQATVVIGILTTDLDRTLLTVRSGPKPFYRLQDGALVLQSEHLAGTHDGFFASAPGPGSLVWRAAVRAVSPRDGHRARVEVLVPPILGELEALCAVHPCQVVVFEGPDEVQGPPGWRVDLIREHVALPVWLAREALGPEPLQHYGTDRHLSAGGNRAVAEALAELLTRP